MIPHPGFSHLGLCVSDLERSTRFYCEALGFETGEERTIGAEFSTLMELDGVKVRSRFIGRDGVSIELLGYEHPAVTGTADRRPLNQLGLTHLCIRVADVEAAAARIEKCGGTVHRGTRTTFGETLDFLYCTDPDGVRIELMRLP